MPQRSGTEKETGKEKKESRVFFVRARSGVLPSSVCPEPVLANDRVCVCVCDENSNHITRAVVCFVLFCFRRAAWTEPGNVYVQANIRGGGEFGPAWHQAALREKRNKAFEDFIAVGEDLIRRGVCTSAQLGCQGGSNGGLLVGNMLTMRPDLFGAIVCQERTQQIL